MNYLRNSMFEIKSQAINNKHNTSGYFPKLYGPEQCNKLKQQLFSKLNSKNDVNNQLLVYRYQPTSSFYLSRGFKKQSKQFQRSPIQNQIILSKFLVDYLNKKTILDRADIKKQHHKHYISKIMKEEKKIDPGYTYRLNKNIRNKKKRQINKFLNEEQKTMYFTNNFKQIKYNLQYNVIKQVLNQINKPNL